MSIFLYSGLLVLTKFCLYLLVNISVSSFKKSNTSQETFISLEDVLKTSSRHVLKASSTGLQRNNFPFSVMSWRRLEDVLMTKCKYVLNTSRKTSKRLLGRQKSVTLKTSSRCVEDILKTFDKTSWKTEICYAENIFMTSWRYVLKRSWRHVFKTSSIHLGDRQDVYWEYPYLTNPSVYLTNLYFANLRWIPNH